MAEDLNRSSGWSNVPDGRWERSLFFLEHVWDLFRGDRALMAVAAVGTVLNVLAAAVVFGLAEWLVGDVDARVFMGLSGAAIALPSTIVSTYCNVALLRMAQARFEGRRCTTREGFAAANTRLGAIVGWSLLAVGVGALLDWIADKVPGLGAVASWILGAAWTLGTMFALPVLALEPAGPRRAARRSVEIFRKRWGEGVAGTVTVSFVTILGTIPGAAVLAAGFFTGGPVGIALAIAGGALLLAAITVSRAMEELFALAVYRFEVLGEGSFGFEPGQLDGFVDLKRTGPRG